MKVLVFALAVVGSISTMKAQSNGTSLYDNSFVHRIDITFQQTSFWDSLTLYYNDAFNNGGDVKYMMAGVTIDGVEEDSIGFKQKGFYSNWGSGEALKKPFKISMSEYNDSKKYDGLKKINLSNGFEDPAIMRDVLAYKFMRDAGINAPRTAYTKLYLNGTYWGLYVMVEEVDKRALKNWFTNNNGNLFKCANNTNLDYQGADFNNYTDEFELQTNKTENNWSGFTRFVKNVNASPSQFNDSIRAVLNVDNYLDVLAADIILFNWDSYYDHGRNFFVYQDSTTNLMEWIPWDYNLSFSTTNVNLIIDYSQTDAKPLVKNMQENAELRHSFFDHVCILMDNYFTHGNLDAFITTTAALIRPALDEDPNKFFTITEFDQSIVQDIQVQGQWGGQTYKGLQQFITERQSAIASQLAGYNHTCTGLSIDEEGITDIVLYPNPFQDNFSIKAESLMDRVEVYSLSGQLLQALTPNQSELIIPMVNYAAGTYMVKVSLGGFVKSFTISKQ